MTLPRLVLTRKQCDGLSIPRIEPQRVVRDEATVTVPERPTMEQPVPTEQWGEPIIAFVQVPIPIGTRVEVGYPCQCGEHPEWSAVVVNTAKCPWRRNGGVVPVATATVAEVERVERVRPGTPFGYEIGWHATLTDIEAVS